MSPIAPFPAWTLSGVSRFWGSPPSSRRLAVAPGAVRTSPATPCGRGHGATPSAHTTHPEPGP